MGISDWSADVCSSDLVSGTVRATTYDSSATALLINAGSTVNYIYNSGSITATISSHGAGSTTAVQALSGTLTSTEAHTSELPLLLPNPYAALCMKTKTFPIHLPYPT